MSFINNQRAVLLYKSTLNIVKSNVTFVGNAAKNSGGVWYIYNSTVNVVKSAHMIFSNNSGTKGGGSIVLEGIYSQF